MSEWWTYRLSNFLLFSPRTYYRLFELYNREVWPLHIFAIAAGTAILVLALRSVPVWRGRAAALILAVAWVWVAWAFHWNRFSTIQLAAKWFAAAFVVEATLLIGSAVRHDDRSMTPPRPATRWIAIALLAFALFIEPAIGVLTGRSWWSAEIFGIAPDPTAVATLGAMLFARWRFWLLIIPLLWCVVSGATLWTLHAPEAIVLPVAGVAALCAYSWLD